MKEKEHMKDYTTIRIKRTDRLVLREIARRMSAAAWPGVSPEDRPGVSDQAVLDIIIAEAKERRAK